MDPETLSGLLAVWGYGALLLLLLLTGIGSPIPEDLLLLTAGYLLFAGVLHWPLALIASGLGVVGSDLLLYAGGRQIARRRWLTAERLARGTRWFERVGDVAILIARLVPGTRALVFVTAGMKRVPLRSFLTYDLAGAALWVPALLAVGFAAGKRIGDLGQAVAHLERGLAWLVPCALLLLGIWLWWGREESKL